MKRPAEKETVERALGQIKHEVARVRSNRYGPLLRLERAAGRSPTGVGRLSDHLPRRRCPTMTSRTLSALASL